MTRSELIEQLADSYPALPREVLVRLVAIIFASVADQLVRGGRVELRGFGSFATKSRIARLGSNPRSGEPVDVAAKRVPAFRASRAIIARLNTATFSPRAGSQTIDALTSLTVAD